MAPRILIAGIGNIFLGDDAFGVEVVQKLAASAWPENVRVVDFGIRGFDLTMALLEDHRPRHPGGRGPARRAPRHPLRHRARSRPSNDDPRSRSAIARSALSGSRSRSSAWSKTMGDGPRRVLVVGCEPANVRADLDWDVTPGLSEPVQQALDEAVELVDSFIREAHLGHLALEAR